MQRSVKPHEARTGIGLFATGLALAVVIPLGTGPAVATSDTLDAAVDSGLLAEKVLIGRSVKGRAIMAQRQGNPDAARVLLVIGQMHGDEPKGPAVVRSLRQRHFATTGDVAIWTISTINPDGQARRSRVNARSVDLNRNFPTKWRRLPKTGTYSGPRPASETETTVVMNFIERVHPDAVMSFHQPLNTVMAACDRKARPWVRRIGRLAGLPVPAPRNCNAFEREYPGTLNKWYSANSPGWFATVELPESSAVNGTKIRRYTDAVVAVSREFKDKP